jgi:cell division FtsZ-interacting protein ZapD
MFDVFGCPKILNFPGGCCNFSLNSKQAKLHKPAIKYLVH